jgi:histidinol-phosphate aminotransferase
MNLSQTLSLINSDVKQLKAYHLKPDPFEIKLNQNESPFDWPEQIKEDFAEFCKTRPWNRYPDFIPVELKNTIAEYVGTSPDNIIAGNGSNEMLLVLLLSLTDSNSSVILCQPTFTVYQLLTKGLGRKLLEVYLNNDLSYNTDTIIEASLKNPKSLLILCSPNNPTGTSLSETQIREILDKHSGFCILDQAYVEFGGYNAIPLLHKYPNLIITRTFSKAFSGAGLRFGYMIGNAEIIKEINKIKLPYNVNFFTEYLVRIMFSNSNIIEESVKKILSQKKKLIMFLNTLPFDKIYPSTSNFILVRTKLKDSLFSYLKKNDILLRDVSSYPMLEDCLRICVGTEEENERVMDKIAQFFKEHKKKQ